MDSTDDGLLARAVHGDADALSALLEQHGPGIAARLRIPRRWRSLLEQTDVMQVTYREVFLHIRQFDPLRARSFPAWLRQIAAHNLRDAIRSLERHKQPQPRHRVEPGGDSWTALYEQVATASATPSRAAARAEAQRLLTAAVARLPREYARVVKLCDLEGRPIEEVAAALGRSVGAVYMLRSRAHQRLRELLGPGSRFFSA